MTAPAAARTARATLKARTLILLDDLGCTADEVAQSLAKLGVTGCVMDCGACPVANYLGTKLNADRVEVSPAAILVRAGSAEVEIVTPVAVALFMTDFDTEHYPHLIRRAA